MKFKKIGNGNDFTINGQILKINGNMVGVFIKPLQTK
jgi:hypothetical protein